MSMVMDTGKTELRRCHSCGVELLHRKVVGISCSATGKTAWRMDRHKAPCGQPCLGGGIRSADFRPNGDDGPRLKLKEVAHTADACPRCGGGDSHGKHGEAGNG